MAHYKELTDELLKEKLAHDLAWDDIRQIQTQITALNGANAGLNSEQR